MSSPLLFRRVGDRDWRSGSIVNISRTGVLFTGHLPGLVPATGVEFVLMLQSLGHPGQSRVRCRGKVLRHAGERPGAAGAVAVTIESYEFLGVDPDAPAVDG
jgi:hypothetical protein